MDRELCVETRLETDPPHAADAGAASGGGQIGARYADGRSMSTPSGGFNVAAMPLEHPALAQGARPGPHAPRADHDLAAFPARRHGDADGGRGQLVIGVERRAFFQGCLSLWLSQFCGEFAGSVVDDLRTEAGTMMLAQAAAVIIGVGPPAANASWVEQQVAWLRGRRPDVPIAAIVDDAQQEAAEALVERLGLQGYIPASTSVNVAAAAVRLIVAGGLYLPRVLQRAPTPRLAAPVQGDPSFHVALNIHKLTPREAAVLELLGRGTPNKIIAYRLGISLSTAKVHVHNITRKLGAHNRTEVALAARQLLRERPRYPHGEPAKAGRQAAP